MRRFSHAATVLNDQVVITHGYFYDNEARASQWLSDTWAMSTQIPFTWRKLHSRCSTEQAFLSSHFSLFHSLASHIWLYSLAIAADGVDADAAQTSYSKKAVPPAPCGRYGATSVVYNEQLWLFGGTDGGFSKKGLAKSKSGSYSTQDVACMWWHA